MPRRAVTTRGQWLSLGAVLLLGACGTEPSAVLTITLDDVPSPVRSATVAISGLVTRTPAKETTIIVTAAGGQTAASDTAGVGGRFTVEVSLNPNTRHQIVLTAQDASGAVSLPDTVFVEHDGVAPSVVSTTPEGDGAGTAVSVEVQFSEPVVLTGAGALELVNQGLSVAGATTLSADSLTATFVPQQALQENAIYTIGFPGVTDAAGNPVEEGLTRCFITELTAATGTELDSTNDLFALGQPTGASPADLVEIRLGAVTGRLLGVLKFTTPRQFEPDSANNAFAYLDLDLDQDSTTGFVTLKDALFSTLDPTLSSGARAEYVIGLDWFPSLADSGAVGRYVDTGVFEIVALLLPDVCGEFFGFSVSFGLLGSDDGNFNYVVLAGNVEANGILVDPAPQSGHYTAGLAGQFASPFIAESDVARRSPGQVVRARFPFRRR